MEFRDTDIIEASADIILSFLQDIALEGSDTTYKGTKYAAFSIELSNKFCALNDENSIYLRYITFKVIDYTLINCIDFWLRCIFTLSFLDQPLYY